MKTQLLKFSFIVSFIILSAIFAEPILQAQSLLNGPQKIVMDKKRNRLLVSNGNDGKLVEIDSAGVQHSFIDTAGFIDGLEIVGDTIYGVGENRELKAYHLDTKQLIFKITFSGGINTNYLSSVTSDSSGHLFISCPELNTIYKFRIRDKAYWVFAQEHGLNLPNGILLERDKNRIVVIDDSPTPSLIHAISLSDSTVTNLDTTYLKRPDGIVRDRSGYYYVGGYYLVGIYRINPDFSGQPTPIYSGLTIVYPTYDYYTHSLLITFYNTNNWARVSLPVGINEKNENLKDFQLNQNYPNPFNPGTNIKFSLKKNSFTKLKVYDVQGKEVATLVNENLKAGNYERKFSVNSTISNCAPSGVYFYKLETDNASETRKMLLIK